MSDDQQQPQTRFIVFKNPAAKAPYSGRLTLPGGAEYLFDLRPHESERGVWYEGFLKAADPQIYARDELLKRNPVAPEGAPEKLSLSPTQIKLNPYPADKRTDKSPDLIGTLWVADGLFTVFARYRTDPRIAFAGSIAEPREAAPVESAEPAAPAGRKRRSAGDDTMSGGPR